MADTTTPTLYDALLAFQADAPTLQKDKINPAFRSKYLSLDSLMEQVLPALNAHGLIWTTLPGRDDDGAGVLRYELIHAASGDRLGGTMPLLAAKPDPQGQGSAITYARRYSLMAVLGLVADEDDDGNRASGRQRAPERANGHGIPTAEPSNGGPRPASQKQRGMLNGKAAEAKLSSQQFANAILTAAGASPREFDGQEQAQAFVQRQLDRLPASLVDKVLEQIATVPA